MLKAFIHNYHLYKPGSPVCDIRGQYFPGGISREMPPREILSKVGDSRKYWPGYTGKYLKLPGNTWKYKFV